MEKHEYKSTREPAVLLIKSSAEARTPDARSYKRTNIWQSAKKREEENKRRRNDTRGPQKGCIEREKHKALLNTQLYINSNAPSKHAHTYYSPDIHPPHPAATDGYARGSTPVNSHANCNIPTDSNTIQALSTDGGINKNTNPSVSPRYC